MCIRDRFITYAQSILAQMEELESLYRPSDRHEVKIQMSVPRASYIADAFTRYIASLGNVPLQVGYRETNSLSVINDVFTGLSSMGVVRFQTQHREYFERLIKSKHLIIQELWEYDMVAVSYTHLIELGKRGNSDRCKPGTCALQFEQSVCGMFDKPYSEYRGVQSRRTWHLPGIF